MGDFLVMFSRIKNMKAHAFFSLGFCSTILWSMIFTYSGQSGVELICEVQLCGNALSFFSSFHIYVVVACRGKKSCFQVLKIKESAGRFNRTS